MCHWGIWVAQSVERGTLDFHSGHDFTVGGMEPHLGLLADSVESAWDSLSLSLSLSLGPFPAYSLTCSRSLSHKINKHKK